MSWPIFLPIVCILLTHMTCVHRLDVSFEIQVESQHEVAKLWG